MQVLKEVKHEYMEDELWEFMEKHILPLLSTSTTAVETKDSNALTSTTTTVLTQYIEELVLSIKETALSEVC